MKKRRNPTHALHAIIRDAESIVAKLLDNLEDLNGRRVSDAAFRAKNTMLWNEANRTPALIQAVRDRLRPLIKGGGFKPRIVNPSCHFKDSWRRRR